MEDVLEQPKLVTMAPGAIAKVKELLAEENNPNLKLRMFVSYNKNKLKPKRREIKQNKYVHVVWCVQ